MNFMDKRTDIASLYACNMSPYFKLTQLLINNCHAACVLFVERVVFVSLAEAGYNFSPQSLGVVLRRHSTHGRIAFDDYVACCVRLRSLTGELPSHSNISKSTIIGYVCVL